ncbi:MAG: AAA family ATPase [Chloroflexota bacterium]
MNLSPGFNVIVGQNNAGKTALVEALSLRYTNKPHITIQTKPTINSPIVDLSSRVIVRLGIQGAELTELLMPFEDFYAPVSGIATDSASRFRELLVQNQDISIQYILHGGNIHSSKVVGFSEENV